MASLGEVFGGVVDVVFHRNDTNNAFSVAAGTTHALVGESGSGKTTTVRLLLGLEHPDAGEITVDGARPADLPALDPDGEYHWTPDRPDTF